MKLTDLEDYHKVDNRFDQLENKIDARFNALEAKVNALDAKLNGSVNAMDAKLNGIKTLIWVPVAAAVAQIIIVFLK